MSGKRITPEETARVLMERDRFLILTHRRPDGDTIGCASALTLALRACGKTAYAHVNPELTPRYARFLQPLYPPEGYVPDTVVSTDVPSLSQLPDNAMSYADAIDLAIDHHGTNAGFARLYCVDADAAACGELVYAIIRLLGVPLTSAMADALYAAISTDTGCFRYSNTTARTHRIVADLMDAGCDAAGLNFTLFEMRTPARVAIESAVMRGIVYYAGGAVAVARVTRALIDATGATEDDMESLSSLPKRIEGVRIGVTLYERHEGIKASVRTDKTVDASRICALVGGGGHPRAAGCTLYNTSERDAMIEDAETVILDAVRRTVEDLPWTT